MSDRITGLLNRMDCHQNAINNMRIEVESIRSDMNAYNQEFEAKMTAMRADLQVLMDSQMGQLRQDFDEVMKEIRSHDDNK
jgi:hypothetical protein